MDGKKILVAVLTIVAVLAVLWLAGPLRTVLNKNNNTIKHIDINKLPIVRVEIPIPKHTCKSWYCDYDRRVWGTFNRKYIIMLNNTKLFEKTWRVSVCIGVRLNSRKSGQIVRFLIDKPAGIGILHIPGICSDLSFGYGLGRAGHWVTKYSLNINVTYELVRLDIHNCTEKWIVVINNTWKKTFLASVNLDKNGRDRFINTNIGPVPVDLAILAPEDIRPDFTFNVFAVAVCADAVRPTGRPMIATILKLR